MEYRLSLLCQNWDIEATIYRGQSSRKPFASIQCQQEGMANLRWQCKLLVHPSDAYPRWRRFGKIMSSSKRWKMRCAALQHSRMQTADPLFKSSRTLQRATNAHSNTGRVAEPSESTQSKQQQKFWVRESRERESQWKQHDSCKYSNWNYRSKVKRNATTYPEKVVRNKLKFTESHGCIIQRPMSGPSESTQFKI